MKHLQPSTFFVLVFYAVLNSTHGKGDEFNITSYTLPPITNETSFDEMLEIRAMERWRNVERLIHRTAKQALRNFMLYATDKGNTIGISSRCMSDVAYVTRALTKLKYWAYRMLDASSHIPSGILSGSLADHGDYDGCLSIKVRERFRGKFCSFRITPLKFDSYTLKDLNLAKFFSVDETDDEENFLKRVLNMIHPYYAYFTVRGSVCLPSSCTEEDLTNMLNTAMKYLKLDWVATPSSCNEKDEVPDPFSAYEIVAMLFTSTLVTLALCGTLLELYFMYIKKQEKYHVSTVTAAKFFLCFSCITNTRRIFAEDNSSKSIKVFHGMKFFTICWVILNHAYNSIAPEFMTKAFEIKHMLRTGAFQVVVNGYPTVDTFFFISAVIVVYSRMHGSKAFNIPLTIFRRVWRLGPPVLFVTFFFFLCKRIGSGPLWKENIAKQNAVCENYWWANLGFMSNMLKSENIRSQWPNGIFFRSIFISILSRKAWSITTYFWQTFLQVFLLNSCECLGWIWYVGAEMQLFMFSLSVVVPIKTKPKLGLTILGVSFFLSIIAIIVNQVYYNLPPTVVITAFNSPEDVYYVTERAYYPSYVHITTYCIGMATGYILYKYPKIRIPLWANIAGWLVSFGTGLTVIYCVYKWNVYVRPTMIESVFYAVGSKIGWGLALAWVTIMTYTGNGGFITKFLSWSAFIPFSRLTYSTYLVHMFIQMYFWYSLRTPIEVSHRILALLYVAFVVTGFMSGFGATQLIEAPFMAIEKLVFRKDRRRDSSKTNGNVPEEAVDAGNVNHAFENGDKGYIVDDNKAQIDYKPEEVTSGV